MEDKSQIVEKRVKSTIIRRRKEAEPETSAPQAVPAAAPAPAAPVAASGPKKITAPAAAPAPHKPAKPEVAPISSAVAAAAKPSAVPASVPTTTSATATPAATQVPAAPAKKEPRFIDLSQFKPANKQTKSETPATPAAASEVVLEDEETDKKEKKPAKKGAKRREGGIEVDIDGIGRVSTITQLTRVVHADRVERVFQPSRTAPTGGRKKKPAMKRSQHQTLITQSKAIKRVVEMSGSITVADLAHAMDVKAGEVIKKLMSMGTMATANQAIDLDTATLVAQEFHYEVKDVSFNEAKVLEALDAKAGEGNIETRPPVVTVMGHVDHGKTSLLDAIRQANVAAGEAGGITQHIGAYTVTLPQGKITFLDTPGHEAFTTMRARGAAVTDLVILVVAADDGVMPQTAESIDHAKAAGVPIIVAVNKIDKPEADIERIKRQLAERELVPEEWGGDTMYCLVSAKQKQGIKELLEAVLLQAEVLELNANSKGLAKGVVLEASLDRSRGPLATVLVQQGTLRIGDILVAGQSVGKIRAMQDYNGKPATEASPSYAVQILGLDSVPMASDTFHVTPDEQVARTISENRLAKQKKLDAVSNTKVSLEDFFAKSKAGEVKELNVIVKADVQGSLEAVTASLNKLPTEKVTLKIIHSSVGGVNESDILLASASKAIIIGFNVRPETKAIALSKAEGVDVRMYKIIYEMIDDVKLAMRGLLAPTRKEKYLGRAEIREVFTVSKIGNVAGCYVIDGKLVRNAGLRLLRESVVLHEGKISTLKRFKDDAKEVAQGFECGLSIEGYSDVKKGDLIEAFEVELIQTEL